MIASTHVHNEERRMNTLRLDPTRTTLLRKAFVTDVTKRLRELKRRIFELVVTEDAFAIAPPKPMTFNKRWIALSSDQKVEQFRKWVEDETKRLGLTGVDTSQPNWLENYIREAYETGAGRSFDDYRKKYGYHGTAPSFYAGSKHEFLGSFRGPASEERVKYLVSRSFGELKGVTGTMTQQMSRTLADGMIQGNSPRDVARALMKNVDKIGETRAKAVARTETIRAHAEGQLDSLQKLGVEEVGVMVEWSTAGDDLVCPLCLPMEGVVLKIGEARGAIPRHPNCVVGETVIYAPDALTVMSAKYTGEIIDVTTSDGSGVSVTVNHVMLTQRGWVFAKDLVEGDYLLNAPEPDGRDFVKDDYQAKPSIEDIYNSLLEMVDKERIAETESVPHYFHGDGRSIDSEIQIISLVGELSRQGQMIANGKFVENLFGSGNVRVKDTTSLDGYRLLSSFLVGTAATADCLMSKANISEMLRARSVFHHESVRDEWVADLDASFFQARVDSLAAHAKPLRQLVDTDSFDVEINDLVDWWRNTSVVTPPHVLPQSQIDTNTFESASDSALRESATPSNFVSRLPGVVLKKKIVSVDRRHVENLSVYDVSTKSTSYIANGFISSNCRCAWIPANVGESRKGQIRTKSDIDKARTKSIKAEIPKKRRDGTKRTLQERKDESRWQGTDMKVTSQRLKDIIYRKRGPAGPTVSPAAAPNLWNHQPTAVVRWMGQQGWSLDDAQRVMRARGIDISESTIKTQLGAGRKGLRGGPAPLTSDQIAELERLRKGMISTPPYEPPVNPPTPPIVPPPTPPTLPPVNPPGDLPLSGIGLEEHPKTALARWMGKEGFKLDEAMAAFKDAGIDMAEATLRTQLNAGRKGLRGAPASLNDGQAKALLQYRKSGIAPPTPPVAPPVTPPIVPPTTPTPPTVPKTPASPKTAKTLQKVEKLETDVKTALDELKKRREEWDRIKNDNTLSGHQRMEVLRKVEEQKKALSALLKKGVKIDVSSIAEGDKLYQALKSIQEMNKQNFFLGMTDLKNLTNKINELARTFIDTTKMTAEELFKHNIRGGRIDIASTVAKQKADDVLAVLNEQMKIMEDQYEMLQKYQGQMKLQLQDSTHVTYQGSGGNVLGCYWSGGMNDGLMMLPSEMQLTDKHKLIGTFSFSNGMPGTFRHEYGHHVWYRMLNGNQKAEWGKLFNELGSSTIKNRVTIYAASNEKELWSEAFAIFTDPEYGKTVAGAPLKLPEKIEKTLENILGKKRPIQATVDKAAEKAAKEAAEKAAKLAAEKAAKEAAEKAAKLAAEKAAKEAAEKAARLAAEKAAAEKAAKELAERLAAEKAAAEKAAKEAAERLAAEKAAREAAEKAAKEAAEKLLAQNPANPTFTPASELTDVQLKNKVNLRVKGEFRVDTSMSAKRQRQALENAYNELERMRGSMPHVKDWMTENKIPVNLRMVDTNTLPGNNAGLCTYYHTGKNAGRVDIQIASLGTDVATQTPTFGKFSTSSSIGDTIRHEYGHNVWFKGIKPTQRAAFESEITKMGAKAVEQTISKYGASNVDEAFAEAFSAYTHPGYYQSQRLPEPIEKILDTMTGRASPPRIPISVADDAAKLAAEKAAREAAEKTATATGASESEALDALKKMRARDGYLSVEKHFFMVEEQEYSVAGADFLQKGEVVRIKVSGNNMITATQEEVFKDRVKTFIQNPNMTLIKSEAEDKLPKIYQYRGRFYIHDGHHRMTAAALRKEEYIDVVLLKDADHAGSDLSKYLQPSKISIKDLKS